MSSPLPLRLHNIEGIALMKRTINKILRYLSNVKYRLTPGPNSYHEYLFLKG